MSIKNYFRHIFRGLQRQTLRYIQFEYQPVKGLEKKHEKWISRGNDPVFKLISLFNAELKGWYMVELKLSFNSVKNKSTFYFDFWHGFNDENSLILPLRRRRVSKRLCFFSIPPKSIHFVPLETEGEFTIENLRFVKVTESFAKKRMITKIQNNATNTFFTKNINANSNANAKEVDLKPLDSLFEKYNRIFAPDNYKDWAKKFEHINYGEDNKINKDINRFSYHPVISVVVPVYNTDEKFLKSCIDSVLNQSYKNWELCIADDASTERHVKAVVKEYAKKDSRIRLTFRKKNGHISEATNSALSLVRGEFITFLDHDDELFPHALYEVVRRLNKYPDADIIYSDEDKIDEDGNRFEPHFKTDWNPALFYSQNYISHLAVYRTDLVKKVGGLRTGVEGSQDYDLLLRCVSHISEDKIHHIPSVLYHWRAIIGSTALTPGQKSYTTDAGVKALKGHFNRLDKSIKVEKGKIENIYKLTYEIPDPAPMVSLLIPTRDGHKFLSKCVESILSRTTYSNYEIIILDNQSECLETIDYFDKIRNERNVRIIKFDQPFNYSSINNFGVKHANGSVIGLINNDIEVISSNWLDEMVSHALRDEIGCVGAKLYYPDDTIQHAGVVLGIGGLAGHPHKYFNKKHYGYFSRLMLTQNVSAVTAACLIVRRDIFEEVNGLDDQLAIAFNDVDFCLRVRERGYKNLWTPHAELYHHESVSRGYDDSPEKQKRFWKEVNYMKNRWGETLYKDPYYNPNLTLIRDDFSLKEL